MEKNIYHGSEYVIEEPLFGKGNRRNDFGKGFYCTENIELAKEWACARKKSGFANAYRFEDADLNILYLQEKPYTILHWLALLAENRTYWQKSSIAEQAKEYLRKEFLINTDGYDVIIGYRADDSYFTFAQEFISGVISLQKLREAMMLGKLGEQIVVKSQRAFQRLQFIGAETAPEEIYFTKKAERDQAAKAEYRNIRKAADSIEDLFMLDILREEVKPDDPRLQ